MAKIQIKSEKLTPFGGIFMVMEQFAVCLKEVTVTKKRLSVIKMVPFVIKMEPTVIKIEPYCRPFCVFNVEKWRPWKPVRDNGNL